MKNKYLYIRYRSSDVGIYDTLKDIGTYEDLNPGDLIFKVTKKRGIVPVEWRMVIKEVKDKKKKKKEDLDEDE